MWQLSAVEMRAAIRDGKATVAEVAEAHLARIAAREPTLHAWVTHDPEAVRAQAAGLAKAAAALPLLGLPIGIKDNICVEGREARCASKILEGFRAPYDATVIARLKAAGAAEWRECFSLAGSASASPAAAPPSACPCLTLAPK